MKKNNKRSIWKGIKQKFSRLAKWNFLRRLAKKAFRVKSIIVVLLVSVGAYSACVAYSYWKEFYTKHQLLEKISFRTDGTLRAKDLFKDYNFKKGEPLFAYDISEVKSFLSQFRQIKSIVVKKVFPSKLSIEISEQKPMLRWKRNYCISSDGTVFKASGYSSSHISSLPLLIDVHNTLPHKSGFQAVDELFRLARSKFPEFFMLFNRVSLKNFDYASSSPWSTIKIFTMNDKLIVFSDKDFVKQLNRLRIIIANLSNDRKKYLKSIDLSLTDPIISFR